MSHFLHDADEYETVITSTPCTSCGGNLGKCRGIGCNGSSGIGSRKRAPDEVAKIKSARMREHEDAILAEADAIRRRRA